MWHDLLVGLAFVLILEGLLPFLHPGGMRRMMRMLSETDDRQLRFAGLTSLIIGAVLLHFLNN
jgi:uncharacterized protein YjeT (DUF2065 family)